MSERDSRNDDLTSVVRVFAGGSVVIETVRHIGAESSGRALSLRDVESFELIQRVPLSGKSTGVTMDLTDRFLVWAEDTVPDLGVEAWELFAFDRSTGRTRQLTQAPKVGGLEAPPAPGYTGPQISGDQVFWAQVGGTFGHERVDIFGCRIAACEPRRYVAGAAYPSATSKALYFIKTDRFLGKDSWPEMSVGRLDLEKGAVTWLHREELHGGFPLGFAASERYAVWTIGRRGADVAALLEMDSGHITRVTSERAGIFGYPVATDRYVAWAESSGTAKADVGGYLYDFEARHLYSLGNMSGLYGIEGDGSLVHWQESKTPGAIRPDVVNVIGRLPELSAG